MLLIGIAATQHFTLHSLVLSFIYGCYGAFSAILITSFTSNSFALPLFLLVFVHQMLIMTSFASQLLHQPYLLVSSVTTLSTIGASVFIALRNPFFSRKVFHFTPSFLIPLLQFFNPWLMQAALGGGFFLLLSLELLRHFSPQLKFHLTWMIRLNADRESGFYFTHLFLFLSLLLSAQLDSIGIPYYFSLILMAADAFASIVGQLFGKHRVVGNKTIQGSTAYLITFLCLWLLLQSHSTIIESFIFGSIMMVTELVTGDLDNIVPLYIAILYKIYIFPLISIYT